MRVSDPNEQPTPQPSRTSPAHRSFRIVRRGRESIEARLRTAPRRESFKRRKYYVPVRAKFFIATTVSGVWLYVSWLLAQNWLTDIAQVTGYVPAALIIFFIALLPGFLNTHVIASLLLDQPRSLSFDLKFPKINLLIAVYNEEENIAETIRGIRNQDYPGEIEIVIVDDSSTDNTVRVLRSYNLPNLKIVQAYHQGKGRALNEGLKHVTQPIVVCIDANTFLHPQALRRIIARFLTDPEDTAAVAGCVLVKNSRSTFMTRLQEWDYFIGIASAKRQQSLYQGTLVAQGAFSAFRTKILKTHQGWPTVIGEDIVLTWSLIHSGWRVGFEPTAVGFTHAPQTFRGFYRQRKRWARGMVEGMKRHGQLVWKGSRLAAFFVGIDFIIPFVSLFHAFLFLPGFALMLSGQYYILAPMTLLVMPSAFLIVLIMLKKQKAVFTEIGLKIRQNLFGFFIYILIYQPLVSPICAIGYSQDVLDRIKEMVAQRRASRTIRI